VSWPTESLGAICEIVSGITKDSKKQGDDYREVPYLRVANVQRLQLDLSEVKTIPAKESAIANYRLEPGDILLNEGGDRDKLGRGWIWQGQISECIHQNHVFRARIRNGKAIPKWIAYYANTNEARAYFLATGKQTTNLASISKKNLGALPVPLPPVDIQQSIIAEIDTQLSRLDETVATLQGIQAKLKQARASILKAAVEGRLVETEARLSRRERRDYESAAESILSIKAPPRPNRYNTRSSDVIHGHAGLSVGDTNDTLPEGWIRRPLITVARMESGHTPSRKRPEWWRGDIPWIGIPDARDHHGGTIYETYQTTNHKGLSNSAARLLPEGTVCVSRTASVGYVVVMGRCMATSQDFVNWVCSEALLPHWLQIVFLADREALRSFGKGSVHKTIYYPELLSLHVAIPPVAEQHRIAKEVGRRFAVLDQVEATVQTTLARCGLLRQAILKRAFRG
jgi:type I restriction enzyme S subunit